MREPSAFINLSGGVDSTYYLWRWLRENPDELILVHHCLFLMRRLKEEKEACDNILNYLVKENLSNFLYVETGMQKGNLNKRTLDIEMLCGMASIIVKSYPEIKTMLLPYSREETSALNAHYESGNDIRTYDNTHRYWKVNKVLEVITGRDFDYLMYREGAGIISKQRMIQDMPDELFRLTWYCRRPQNGLPCGKCHTCRKVFRAKQNLGK
jgi:hypothetical protein